MNRLSGRCGGARRDRPAARAFAVTAQVQLAIVSSGQIIVGTACWAACSQSAESRARSGAHSDTRTHGDRRGAPRARSPRRRRKHPSLPPRGRSPTAAWSRRLRSRGCACFRSMHGACLGRGTLPAAQTCRTWRTRCAGGGSGRKRCAASGRSASCSQRRERSRHQYQVGDASCGTQASRAASRRSPPRARIPCNARRIAPKVFPP